LERRPQRKENIMDLEGKRVAVLVEDAYADLELWYSALRLREAGAEVIIVGTGASRYVSQHGIPIHADISAQEVGADDFDAIVIPGGAAPEAMRRDPAMVALVHDMEQHGKVVAAISYAGQAMASAHDEHDAHTVRFFGLKARVVREEAAFAESAVIREGNLITARSPVDLPAFCRMIIAALVVQSSTPLEHVKNYG
jgi:protease I